MANHQTVRFGALWPSTVFTTDPADPILRMKLRDSYPTIGNAVTLATGAISTIDEYAFVYVRACTVLTNDESVTLVL